MCGEWPTVTCWASQRTTSMRGEWPTVTCWASQRTTSMCGEWPTVTCWASQNYIYVWWMAHSHMLILSELHLCVVNGPQSHAEPLRTTSMCGEWPTVTCWSSQNYIYVWWMAHSHMLSLSELHLCVVNGPQSHAEPLRTTSTCMCGEWPTVTCWASQRELHLCVVNSPQSHAVPLRELHLCVVNGPQSHTEPLRTTSMCGEWPIVTCWASQRTTSMCGEWTIVTYWASQNTKRLFLRLFKWLHGCMDNVLPAPYWRLWEHSVYAAAHPPEMNFRAFYVNIAHTVTL